MGAIKNDAMLYSMNFMLGAVMYVTHRVGRNRDIFSHHFFDEDGLEVAYRIEGHEYTTVLETPREWDNYFMQHPDYEVYPIGKNKIPKQFLK